MKIANSINQEGENKMVFGKERPLITVETTIDCEDNSECLFIKAPKIIHDQIVNMLGTNFLDYDILDLTGNN